MAIHQPLPATSMKVPTRRRGNRRRSLCSPHARCGLNESPRPKTGKLVEPPQCKVGAIDASMKVPTRRRGNIGEYGHVAWVEEASMKVPARRQGNGACDVVVGLHVATSMKVPTRRRGNPATSASHAAHRSLNESPHPKAGEIPSCRITAVGPALPQ